MADDMRRAPARPKDVEDVDPQNDIRVRVIGTVLSKDEELVTVDDGTGNVDVFLDEEELESLSEGDRVRVFGRVLPTPDGFELQGEVVQDFSGIEKDLRDRVKKVVNTTR